MIRLFSFFALLVAAAAGCGGGRAVSEHQGDDCVALLIWRGVAYEGVGLPKPPPAARSLGKGVVPECEPQPKREVEVAAIRGIHPSVAVSTPRTGSGGPPSHMAWLGPGYVAQSPLHPLREKMRAADSWRPNTYPRHEWDCENRRVLRVRARQRPPALAGFVQVAADRKTEAFLRGDDIEAHLVLASNTAFVRMNRHGVPFIERGARLSAEVRECVGEDDEPGLRGLRLVVVTRLRALDR